jgi:hypothetical protein
MTLANNRGFPATLLLFLGNLLSDDPRADLGYLVDLDQNGHPGELVTAIVSHGVSFATLVTARSRSGRGRSWAAGRILRRRVSG